MDAILITAEKETEWGTCYLFIWILTYLIYLLAKLVLSIKVCKSLEIPNEKWI